jgi:hypothetical protein
MPSAFAVANSPLTSNGTIEVTGAGTVGQYIRGDGSLADFPESSGGGSSVSYYLNGSVNQGTIGGVAYKELNKVPILGAGTQFSIAADGYIASFLTDAGDPNLIEIPGGNWNFETYFSASSGGGSPTFYVELYKYNGTTFTLIASSVTSPELIAFGTNLTPYFSTLAVPTTTLALTDRLAIRYYVTHAGRTITMHTENNTLCQIITTFTTGITALNGLTAQVQNFAVGTTGTDFNIASATATHTFNLPTASATNRGALSSTDWTTFNSKENAITAGTTAQYYRGDKTFQTLNTSVVPELTNLYYTEARVSANTDVAANTAARHNAVTLGTANGLSLSTQQLSLGLASAGVTGALSGTDWSTFNSKQNALTNPVTGTGNNNYIPRFTSTGSTIGNSAIQTNSNGDLMVGSADAGNAGSINVSVGIAGSTSGGLQLWSSNLGTHYLQFGDGTTGEQAYAGYIGYSHSTNAFVFGTDSGNRMRIFSDGNVSISNFPSNGGFKLDVNGTGRFIGNLTAASFIRSGGTSSQFLKADGSVDSTAYGTGSVTSVAALTLGTSGTDLSSTVANGTTTPVITLNVPTASATNRGALSAADWTTFNGKQQALNGTGFVKIAGTTISYDNTSYLPLTGGTLTGTLNGTTAVFSNTVTGFQGTFTDGNQGLIIGYYTNGNGFGAIYPSTVTPNNSNYSFIAKNDSTVLHAATGGSVSLSINNVASLTIDSSRNAQLAGKFSLRADASASVTTQIPVFIANPSATTRELVTRTPAQFRSDIGAQAALTNPVTGTGTSGQVAFFNGTSSITGESNLFWDSTNDYLGIGTNSPAVELAVYSSSVARIHVQNSTSGTAFNDGFQFAISDSDGYLWNFENASIIFGTNNSAKMFLNSSGNLGLGVTPSAWTLSPAIQLEQASLLGDNEALYVSSNAFFGSLGWTYINSSAAASQYYTLGGQHVWRTAASGTAGNAISFTQAMTLGSNSGLSIGTPSAAPSQGLLVQGNVGIGGSPSQKLDVIGYARATSGFVGNGGLSLWGDNASSAAGLFVATGGNVGIGTNSPQSIFHIGKDAPPFAGVKPYTGLSASYEGFLFDYYYNTSASNLRVFDIAALGFAVSGAGGSELRFLTVPQNSTNTPLERLKIDSTGAATFSSSGFNVATFNSTFGQMAISFANSGTTFSQIGSGISVCSTAAIDDLGLGTAGFNKNIVFATGTGFTERMRITSGGNVLIGTTTDAGFKLDVNGTARFTGATASPTLTLANSTGGTLADFTITENTGLIVNSYEGASARSIDFRVAGTSALFVATTGAATFSSSVSVNGSFSTPHTTKSANYTLTASDYTVGFDCASNRTATLPDATTCAGRIYVIYHYNTGMLGSRYVTIDPNGSQTINGLTTFSLQYTYDFSSVMIQSNGSNWIIISDSIYYAPV